MTEPTPIVVTKKKRQTQLCCARWWTGNQILVCRELAKKDKSGALRCEAHKPDRSKLDDTGTPVTPATRAKRMKYDA